MKVIDKLSTYAALIGVVSAIGGGFYAWGEFNNRISVLEKKKFVVNQTVDLNPVNERISKLEVDVLDRISDVEKNIKPTDLTSVLQSIANVREEMASLDIPDEVDLSPVNKSIKELEEKIAELKQEVAIVSKENELQDILIEEIKTRANNPLAN
jgi:prefoldin subunit 5